MTLYARHEAQESAMSQAQFEYVVGPGLGAAPTTWNLGKLLPLLCLPIQGAHHG